MDAAASKVIRAIYCSLTKRYREVSVARRYNGSVATAAAAADDDDDGDGNVREKEKDLQLRVSNGSMPCNKKKKKEELYLSRLKSSHHATRR